MECPHLKFHRKCYSKTIVKSISSILFQTEKLLHRLLLYLFLLFFLSIDNFTSYHDLFSRHWAGNIRDGALSIKSTSI